MAVKKMVEDIDRFLDELLWCLMIYKWFEDVFSLLIHFLFSFGLDLGVSPEFPRTYSPLLVLRCESI